MPLTLIDISLCPSRLRIHRHSLRRTELSQELSHREHQGVSSFADEPNEIPFALDHESGTIFRSVATVRTFPEAWIGWLLRGRCCWFVLWRRSRWPALLFDFLLLRLFLLSTAFVSVAHCLLLFVLRCSQLNGTPTLFLAAMLTNYWTLCPVSDNLPIDGPEDPYDS